jgi:hypothetical protein
MSLFTSIPEDLGFNHAEILKKLVWRAAASHPVHTRQRDPGSMSVKSIKSLKSINHGKLRATSC